MRLLILGGRGMAGHMMVDYFRKYYKYDVHYTSRDQADPRSIFLDVSNRESVKKVIDDLKPDIVINGIGILNGSADKNIKEAILVNSLLPHYLSELTESYGGKLIHISTDCVFSGKRGDYKEDDLPDGTSVYAKTKSLGEINSKRHLTIRTSIIGPELKENGIGLFLWFMKQTGFIKGYQNVFWNGVTTLELAKAVEKMITNNVTGIFHLCTKEKISKYELLKLIQKIFDKNDVEIVPDSEIVLDRTILSTRDDFQYNVPNYESMLVELRDWMLSNE
ncbi:SDR family NAD(P)-dependent oxidoreductase [Bacillus methanolicus]|uniref:dTDP-4-dehydrorhamnose reductase family protein n=1 Tax=Bacillus methanolicus TaxID=1471 RepID=UPI00200C66AF|nr:SDR family oxidoreductase [Bacillus methanolicus]UQD51858.1 SDR family NAD(P)-dependent oxidoreductase [Bacillus methanolicus]